MIAVLRLGGESSFIIILCVCYNNGERISFHLSIWHASTIVYRQTTCRRPIRDPTYCIVTEVVTKKNIRQNDASDRNDCSGQLLEVEKKIMSNESHFLLPSMPVVDAHE